MSSGLTLKQKLQLFKLAKKPRRQIRLKLQVITNSLNLPSLKKSSLHRSNKNIGSQKLQRAMYNINNFKKIDRTKHNYQQQFHKMQQKQNSTFNRSNENQFNNNSKGSKNKEIIKRTIYHSNDNKQFLLKDFRFDMRLSEKIDGMMNKGDRIDNNNRNNNMNNSNINSNKNYSNSNNNNNNDNNRKRVKLNMTTLHLSGKQYHNHTMLMTSKISSSHSNINFNKCANNLRQSQSFYNNKFLDWNDFSSNNRNLELIRLKNQYNSLRNINLIYRDQLQNTYQIEQISMMNNNKITQMMIATNEEFKHQQEQKNNMRD